MTQGLLYIAAVVGLAAARGVILAGRAALRWIRRAADDQPIGDAPAWSRPTEPLPGDCECEDCGWFADQFAALAATMPDLARIDIQRLQALYLIDSEAHQ